MDFASGNNLKKKQIVLPVRSNTIIGSFSGTKLDRFMILSVFFFYQTSLLVGKRFK